MPFTIDDRYVFEPHEAVVASQTCDLSDPEDVVLTSTIELLHQSYGVTRVVEDAVRLFQSEVRIGTFSVGHLMGALTQGLPDPSKEGSKPPYLRNARSEAAEMAAKLALRQAYGFVYPAAPQEGSVNPNLPVLGFDGWGFHFVSDNDPWLVLIQVKATEAVDVPPAIASTLADECRQAPFDQSAISRALTVLAQFLRHTEFQACVIRMLERIGRGERLPVVVAPAIVRGAVRGSLEDLKPVCDVAPEVEPGCIRAVVVSIGVGLSEFGTAVMNAAREQRHGP